MSFRRVRRISVRGWAISCAIVFLVVAVAVVALSPSKFNDVPWELQTERGSSFGAINSDIRFPTSATHSNVCGAAFTAYKQGVGNVLVTAGHCVVDDEGKVIQPASTSIVGADRRVYGHKFHKIGDGEQFVDYALLSSRAKNRYSLGGITGATPLGTVAPITGVAAPSAGSTVCSWGATSGWRCGVVDTVEDAYFTVRGMPSQRGDSGGGVYIGNNVVGITSQLIVPTGEVVVQRADKVMEWEGLTLNSCMCSV